MNRDSETPELESGRPASLSSVSSHIFCQQYRSADAVFNHGLLGQALFAVQQSPITTFNALQSSVSCSLRGLHVLRICHHSE